MADTPNQSKFSFLKKSLPWLGTIASIAVPQAAPLVAIATKILGTKLNKSIAPDASSLTDALTAALGDPAQHEAVLQAEQAYQQAMTQLGYQHESEMEEIAEKDRDSARNREIQVRDYTPEVGFYLMAAAFFITLFCLCRYPIPADNKALIYSGMGTLGALLVAAANYFYGTSRGSERKTELLAQAPAVVK